MVQRILRRLVLLIPLLFVVSILTFFIQSLLPGDPARSLLGVSATQEQYDALRNQLHLNEPILAQYWIYLQGTFHGDFGTSIFTGQPVLVTLSQRLPVSLSLILISTLLCSAIGALLGILSATRGPLFRRVSDVGSLIGGALPNFWVALVFASFFGVTLGILPATGYVPFEKSPNGWAMSLVLPTATLALGGIALIAKVVRDSMLTALSAEHMRTLRASGVPERVLIWRHALKNSSIPLVTVVGLVIVTSLSATVLVETVFVLPGLGSLAVLATNRHDIPVLQGLALTFTVIVVLVNIFVDVAYSILNPKVRTS